jgi:aspartyl/asparaginyl-tRNA synthetase
MLCKAALPSPQFRFGVGGTRRDSKDFSFIELNDGSSRRNLQIIAKNTLPNYAAIQRLKRRKA